MGKALKILGIIIGILVLLVIIAIIGITLFVDPNDYKDEIEQLVEEQTGREFTIAGDIELSFFPWLGVQANGVRLSNAPGFPAEPMVQVEHAGASVQLWPLLSGNVVMDTIYLNGAVVHLAKKANGRTNWEDLIPEGEQPSDAEAAGAGLTGLVVSGVQLEDSTITWADLASDTRYAATNIDLETSEIAFGDPFDLSLGFNLANPATGLKARVELATDATVGAEFMNYRLADLELSVSGQYGKPDPMPLDLSLSANAQAHLGPGTAQVSDLTLNAWNMTATGAMEARNIGQNLSYRGNLDVAEFSPEELLETLTGSAPETRDPDVLNRAALAMALTGTASSLQATLEEAYLDDTQLNGTFSIQDFATMAMAFDLQLDSINLDRYRPPPTEEAPRDEPVPTPGQAAAAGGAMIPVETLRGLNLNGKLHAGSLTVAGMTARDLDITVHAADGRLRIHPLNAQFYSGTYQGDIRIDATGKVPVLHMDETLQGVQAGPLLEDVAGKTWMTGTGGMRLQTTAKLSSPEAVKRSLSGSFRLNFAEGAIFGINIAQRIRQAASLLQGQPAASADAVEKTDFSSLTVAADIQQGIFKLQPISLESPLLRVSGSGSVNLREMHVDVTLKPVLLKPLEGVAALDDLTGKPIPLHISGPLLSPDIGLNLEAALKERVKGELREELKGLLQEDEEQPKDEQAGEEPSSTEDALKQRALDAILGGQEEETEKKQEPPPIQRAR